MAALTSDDTITCASLIMQLLMVPSEDTKYIWKSCILCLFIPFLNTGNMNDKKMFLSCAKKQFFYSSDGTIKTQATPASWGPKVPGCTVCLAAAVAHISIVAMSKSKGKKAAAAAEESESFTSPKQQIIASKGCFLIKSQECTTWAMETCIVPVAALFRLPEVSV